MSSLVPKNALNHGFNLSREFERNNHSTVQVSLSLIKMPYIILYLETHDSRIEIFHKFVWPLLSNYTYYAYYLVRLIPNLWLLAKNDDICLNIYRQTESSDGKVVRGVVLEKIECSNFAKVLEGACIIQTSGEHKNIKSCSRTFNHQY